MTRRTAARFRQPFPVFARGRPQRIPVAEFARQTMEQLRNQPFVPGPTNGPDTLEPGITRTWSIAPAGPTVAPNRLATIQVIVRVDRATGTLGAQNITLTTMRAE